VGDSRGIMAGIADHPHEFAPPGRIPRGVVLHLKMPLAQMLFSTLQRQSEAAAYDIAGREMAVPKLLKAGQ
jgi:hypothetical protein